MTIAEEVAGILRDKDFHWKIDGALRTPTVQDVTDVFERAKELLTVGDSIEIGHMIISEYDDNKYDVYIHLGELQ